ncbi:DUF930 domain-containing protein [Oricola indica]|jgi:hypothetical protein|uniref:DUF930 domain-containing protein n=1 Tax=Oricola indica TaxID=2872591 RepID=UPI001CBE7AE4|nr:DUF930 domain-containing protein [Oricola indica]
MQQDTEKQGRYAHWGVPASVVAHVLVIALLIFGLPLPEFDREEPEAIAVELVPPPEPEAPEPEAEEPEEEEVEQAAEEAPPPPPEDAAGEEQASAQPIQVLRPVFEFGEEETGPRETQDGNSSTDSETDDTSLEPEPAEIDEAAAPLPEPKPPVELTEARTLFSRAVTDDPVAMAAMGSLSRGERGAELCTTELREQLRRVSPLYWPDLLPAYRLGSGTAIEVREAAFRAGGVWYNLSFRCDLDEAATRVRSFAFDVGAPIPREQWRARGFPGG